MIKGPRFQIVKQFFPMAASGSLAGGTGSWALLWAAVQTCHMVRLGQAGYHVGLTAAPTGAKGQSHFAGPGALRQPCPRRQCWQKGLEEAGCSQTHRLTHLHASAPGQDPEASSLWHLEAWGRGSWDDLRTTSCNSPCIWGEGWSCL